MGVFQYLLSSAPIFWRTPPPPQMFVAKVIFVYELVQAVPERNVCTQVEEYR